ncbi:MAG: carboxypeptidase regulatory-like domain-containing protein [Anaerolineae bacterium]
MTTRRLIILLGLVFLAGTGLILSGSGVGAAPAAPSQQSMLGINFIGSAEMTPQADRFQRGAESGAGWDRWVLYWSNIERSPNSFDWSAQDAAFLADAGVGLNVHAVLLTTPDFYARAGVTGKAAPRVDDKRPYLQMLTNALSGRKAPEANPASCAANTYPPSSLGEAPFVMQGGQQTVNPGHHWAWYVYQAVNRYKPGGDLARARGLGNAGIRSWEIWNEPDFACVFFSGTPGEYYQMLKVAYQVIKFADPSATVVSGGLTYWGHEGFFDDFLAAAAADPDKDGQAQNGFYFDALALHWYSNSRNALYQSQAFANKLQQNNMAGKPIWLTESGVPILGDNVGPDDPATLLLGTIDDQANFILQSFAYARWLRAEAPSATDRVFHFQMYDDGIAGAFGPFGLIRNPDHPAAPNTPRPGYAAMQTAARYLDGATPISGSRNTSNGVERMAFRHPNGSRVTVLWNWNSGARTVSLRATASPAVLVDKSGAARSIAASGGYYSIALPGATNFNQIGDPNNAMIGGETFLLVEGNAAPTSGPPTFTPVPPTATATAKPTATPSPTPSPTPPPTPGCVNLVANPGFDRGAAGWTLTGRRAILTASGHSGQAVFLGLLTGDTPTQPDGDTATARQTLQIPASVGDVRLEFWAFTGHLPGPDASDRFSARIADANGATIAEAPLTVDSNGWQAYSLSLAPYLAALKGQTVSVEFSVVNAPTAGNAYMRVDDVVLAVCDAPDPPPSAPLRGKVTDMAGWPIDGASVSLLANAGALGATTDAAGRFEFADVPSGAASLSAAASGYGAGGLRVVAVPGADQELRLPPPSSAVTNGGFESGLDGWQLSGATTPQSGGGGLSGRGAVLGEAFTPDAGHPDGNSTLSQPIGVPDTPGVGLTFAYRMDTAETASGADFFEALVIDGAQRTDVVNHLWHPSAGWAYRWIDLQPWRGRNVTLIFNVYQSSADRSTRVWLDEVSVGSSRTYNLAPRLFLPLVQR